MPARSVSLKTEHFQSALDRFIDEQKPDPLSRKQLERWTLEWEEEETNLPEHTAAETDYTHFLRGKLRIVGDYDVEVTLLVSCTWSSDDSNNGRLEYSCDAHARFLKLAPQDSNDDNNNNNNKSGDRIRKRMVSRLREDAYISKLLPSGGANFLQAHICKTTDELEERVDVSLESIGEAIRRAVWSSAETTIDVVELILSFPSLPTTSYDSVVEHTTALANRAKLRLLEDAMVEACEQEGEDQILDDLSIKEAEEAYIDTGGDSNKGDAADNRKKARSG